MGIGSIITFISPVMLIAEMRIDTVIGIILVLIFTLICCFEFGGARIAWKSEIGGLGGLINSLLFTLLARVIMLFLAHDWYFWANAVFGAGELGIFVLVYTHREFFMPSPEEMERTMRRLEGPMVKTASECPTCHRVVEMNWESCPDCGTRLTRMCATCGTELDEATVTCPHCGASVESVEAITQVIDSLRKSVEEDAAPETRASNYAKLAENYLKKGDSQKALDAYTEAIQSTEYVRKRSYFMVKMAHILNNIGDTNEALDILDSALDLDPEDFAGAADVKEKILSPRKDIGVNDGSPQTS